MIGQQEEKSPRDRKTLDNIKWELLQKRRVNIIFPCWDTNSVHISFVSLHSTPPTTNEWNVFQKLIWYISDNNYIQFNKDWLNVKKFTKGNKLWHWDTPVSSLMKLPRWKGKNTTWMSGRYHRRSPWRRGRGRTWLPERCGLWNRRWKGFKQVEMDETGRECSCLGRTWAED